MLRHVQALQLKTASAIWQRVVKDTSRLVGLLERVVPLIVGTSSLSWVKAVAVFGKVVTVLIAKQGQKGAAIYLKTANISLLRSISGCKLRGSRMAGSAVSLNRSGLPRVIPSGFRVRIRGGDVAVIRLYLGLFTLYRVLDYRGKFKLSTITDPGVDLSREYLDRWSRFLREAFLPMIGNFGVKRLVPELWWFNPRTNMDEVADYDYKKVGRTWWRLPELGDYCSRFIIGTSGPNSRTVKKEEVISPIDSSKTGLKSSVATSSTTLLNDAIAWLDRSSIWGTGLLAELKGLALMSGCEKIMEGKPWELARAYKDYVRDVQSSWSSWPSILERRQSYRDGSYELEMESLDTKLGKIGVREEPGKLRLFAMVDCYTQWVLYPLHRFLYKQLEKIPQDGTFNQVKPVKELVSRCKVRGTRRVYSFDLSAATDRIPVVLQELLLGAFTMPAYASCWRAVLCNRWYHLPSSFTKTFGSAVKAVKYAVGQPMGALSSWAMLAMTHHALVQWAAYRAGYREWFTEYAVLGDDVAIASCDVAAEYRVIMKEIGVEIGFNKSILSDNLSLEFAKRFFYKGEEVTPFPLVGLAVGLLGASFVPEVIRASEVLTGRQTTTFMIAKYVGAGLRAASGAGNRLFKRLPRKLASVMLLLTRPGAPRGSVNPAEWLCAESYATTREVTPETRKRVGRDLLLYVRDELVPSVRRRFEQLAKDLKPDHWPLSKTPLEGRLGELDVWWEENVITWLRQDNYLLTLEAESLAREAYLDLGRGDTRLAEVMAACEDVVKASSLIPVKVSAVKARSPFAEAVTSPKRIRHVGQWRRFDRILAKGTVSRKPRANTV